MYSMKTKKLFAWLDCVLLHQKNGIPLGLHWRGVRAVEGARLESVYTPKVYRGFESLSLRQSN